MSTRVIAAALVAILCTVAGCGRASLIHGRVVGTRAILEEAVEHGARNCAPREVAVAETNLEFAEDELLEGDPNRAEEHFRLADAAAHAAMRMTDPERCLEHDEEPPPPPPPPPGDRDGDGIIDDDDRCPDEPEDLDGNEDRDGCPESEDTDRDGLDDVRDTCPLEPEDPDGYADEDGCPEPDNDLDRVIDGGDRCPTDPEDRDGFQDEDGCPEPDNDVDSFPDVTDACPNEPGIAEENGCPRVYQDVEVTSEGIIIRQQIFFEFRRAVIRPESFGILDTVAQVLRDFADITIEIQGHTDSRGNDASNDRLSQDRAAAVREYLIRAGIDPSRMTARGYGERVPIESNSTDDGRAANRRVEFHRTDARSTP
jgi:outer membrane protein OmpA-like peptidoglycan-associated protein